ARHYKFDLEKPFEELPKKIRDVILRGSGEEEINFSYAGERGTYRRKHTFEGVIPNLERRYRDSESNSIREELAKYLSTRPCEACGGSRLKPEARNVFVADKPLPEIAELPVSQALGFF